ncbi:MAG: hypothetical protein FWG00_00855 [Coriobacteriia bacterium]|nr:hypothetical protein [Coriobacteriia bacterium]
MPTLTSELLLQIVLGVSAVLIFVLIILAIHFIVTVRKVNRTIDDIAPTIKKVNDTIDSIQPAIQRVDPLLERVSLTVDAVNLEIMRADQILADISEVTEVASGAVGKVADITDAPLSLLSSAGEKLRSVFGVKGDDKPSGKSASDKVTKELKSLMNDMASDAKSEPRDKTAEASAPEKDVFEEVLGFAADEEEIAFLENSEELEEEQADEPEELGEAEPADVDLDEDDPDEDDPDEEDPDESTTTTTTSTPTRITANPDDGYYLYYTSDDKIVGADEMPDGEGMKG